MTIAGQTSTKRAKLIKQVREKLSQSQTEAAFELITNAPPKLRRDPELLLLKAYALERAKKFSAARDAATESLKIHKHPETLLVAARCSRAIGDTEKCLRLCEELKQHRPNDPSVAILAGGALEEAGRFDEAIQTLQPVVDRTREKDAPMPLGLQVEWSKLLVQKKHYADAIELIDDTLARQDLPDPIRNTQLYLRSKASDRSKDYDAAAEAAAKANEIGKVPFDPDLYTQQVDALIHNWSAENTEHFPRSKCDSELPIFVAGMPRSGTSLIDQIIDAHPKASGVGELNTIERFASKLSAAFDPDQPPGQQFGTLGEHKWTRAANDYVREIQRLAPPGTERIVNKALGNNKLVGLLAKLFPNTRIIHAIRDPRDVAVSCFMGGFNNRLHAWTTQIDWVAHAWRQSMRMMDHWKQTLDVPILDVHYERLVADPENEMPRIIDFLGLEWDDACREFYKTRRTVRTLSYDQVNRPLYTSSSGRHKNYPSLIANADFPDYDPFHDPNH